MLAEDPPTLRGDRIKAVPKHLSLLPMLGNKFVPFPDTHRFLTRLSKTIPRKFDDLKRVLVWTTFHDEHPNASNDSYPPFGAFPYKKLFVKEGTTPNLSIEEKIQEEVWRTDHSIKLVLNQVRAYITHLNNNRTSRGVQFNSHLLEKLLSNHVAMASDKDRGSLIVSKTAYVNEASAHMDGRLHRQMVYVRGGAQ